MRSKCTNRPIQLEFGFEEPQIEVSVSDTSVAYHVRACAAEVVAGVRGLRKEDCADYLTTAAPKNRLVSASPTVAAFQNMVARLVAAMPQNAANPRVSP